jgi:hypothetical protein
MHQKGSEGKLLRPGGVVTSMADIQHWRQRRAWAATTMQAAARGFLSRIQTAEQRVAAAARQLLRQCAARRCLQAWSSAAQFKRRLKGKLMQLEARRSIQLPCSWWLGSGKLKREEGIIVFAAEYRALRLKAVVLQKLLYVAACGMQDHDEQTPSNGNSGAVF